MRGTELRRIQVIGLASAAVMIGGLVGVGTTAVIRGSGDAAPAVVEPCTEAWAHQQTATQFAAKVRPARPIKTFQSLLGVGTVPSGLCLQTVTELYDRGWTVSSITLTATGHGEDGLPVTFTRTGTDRSEDLNLLYVPLTGCVQVHGVVTATRAGTRSGRPDDVARWTATRMYGRDCAKAPNHGAWQGDDGMLVRR